MRRLLAVLLLASGVCLAQAPALRMDQAAVRLDGKAGGTTPTGTANRFALFGPTGALTTDAGATFSGTGATLAASFGFSVETHRLSLGTPGSTFPIHMNGDSTPPIIGVGSGAAIKFSSSTEGSGTPDLGLARSPTAWSITGSSTYPLYVTDGTSANTSGGLVANALVAQSGVYLPPSAMMKWGVGSSGLEPYGWDLGLARASAGVLKVTDGSTGAGKILVADGSAVAPSVAFASDPTSGFMLSTFPRVVYQGAQRAGITSSPGGEFAWYGVNFDVGGWGDTILRRPAAATLQIGAAANATPVANTLILGESGSGTNIAGANGTISSGIGTGSGAGSSLIFQTPTAHGSDAVAQTPTTRLTLGPNGITLPDNGLGTITPGTLEYKGHTAYFTTYLVRRSIVLAQEVPVTATSVGPSNVTETTVYTIPMAANYLTVGKKINVRLNGTITQRNNAASFATIRVKYAGATVFSVTTPASTALAAQPFEIDIRTVCRAIGSGTSGKLISFGKFNVNGDLVAPKLVMGALTNIDTTAANTFTVTIQWNESNASTGPFTVEMGETLCVDANT